MTNESLADVIYRIEPKESPFFNIQRQNKRRLGRARQGMRAMRRRVAKAPFRPADKFRIKFHEWTNDTLDAVLFGKS